jgi:hypothetical protein
MESLVAERRGMGDVESKPALLKHKGAAPKSRKSKTGR